MRPEECQVRVRLRVRSRVRDSTGFVPITARLRYNCLNVHQRLLASFQVYKTVRELFTRVLSSTGVCRVCQPSEREQFLHVRVPTWISWIDFVERKKKSQQSGPDPSIQSGFHCSYTDTLMAQPFTVQKSFSQDHHHFLFMLSLPKLPKFKVQQSYPLSYHINLLLISSSHSIQSVRK